MVVWFLGATFYGFCVVKSYGNLVVVASHGCGVAVNGRQPTAVLFFFRMAEMWLHEQDFIYCWLFGSQYPIELLKVLIFEAILATDSWKATWITILSPNQNTVEWITVYVPA